MASYNDVFCFVVILLIAQTRNFAASQGEHTIELVDGESRDIAPPDFTDNGHVEVLAPEGMKVKVKFRSVKLSESESISFNAYQWHIILGEFMAVHGRIHPPPDLVSPTRGLIISPTSRRNNSFALVVTTTLGSEYDVTIGANATRNITSYGYPRFTFKFFTIRRGCGCHLQYNVIDNDVEGEAKLCLSKQFLRTEVCINASTGVRGVLDEATLESRPAPWYLWFSSGVNGRGKGFNITLTTLCPLDNRIACLETSPSAVTTLFSRIRRRSPRVKDISSKNLQSMWKREAGNSSHDPSSPTVQSTTPWLFKASLWEIVGVVLVIVIVGVVFHRAIKLITNVCVKRCCTGLNSPALPGQTDPGAGIQERRGWSKKFSINMAMGKGNKQKYNLDQPDKEASVQEKNISQNKSSVSDAEAEINYICMKPLQNENVEPTRGLNTQKELGSPNKYISNEDGAAEIKSAKSEHPSDNLISRQDTLFHFGTKSTEARLEKLESATKIDDAPATVTTTSGTIETTGQSVDHDNDFRQAPAIKNSRKEHGEATSAPSDGYYQNSVITRSRSLARSETIPRQKRTGFIFPNELAEPILTCTYCSFKKDRPADDHAYLSPVFRRERKPTKDTEFDEVRNHGNRINASTTLFDLRGYVNDPIYHNSEAVKDIVSIPAERAPILKDNDPSNQSLLTLNHPNPDRAMSAYRSYCEIDDIEPGLGYEIDDIVPGV